jgi:hypothetical protein
MHFLQLIIFPPRQFLLFFLSFSFGCRWEQLRVCEWVLQRWIVLCRYELIHVGGRKKKPKKKKKKKKKKKEKEKNNKL